MTYGGMSSGGWPWTRFITMKGEPSHSVFVSEYGTSGAGTSVCVRTKSMHRRWSSRSYSGKTGNASGSGARRATNSVRAPESSTSNSTVSLDMPFPGAETLATVASAAMTSRAHFVSRAAISSGSRRHGVSSSIDSSVTISPGTCLPALGALGARPLGPRLGRHRVPAPLFLAFAATNVPYGPNHTERGETVWVAPGFGTSTN